MGSPEAADNSSDDFVLVDRDIDVQENVPSAQLESRRATVSEWLRPTDYNADSGDLHKHLKARSPGTCKWLKDRQEFQEWQSDSVKGLLWVEGVPGSGKSVLASKLVEDLSKDGARPVVFFFFRRIIETNKTPQSLLRDWMSQLLSCSAILLTMLEREMTRHSNVATVQFDVLWHIFVSAIYSINGVYCIVDALDEMEPGHEYFYTKLDELARIDPSTIRILATSRQFSVKEAPFSTDTTSKVKLNRHKLETDISTYTENRLHSAQFEGIDEETSQRLQETVCRLSNGLFLYARLTLDDLAEKASQRNANDLVESLLIDLPTGMNDLYSTLLRQQRLKTGSSVDQQKLTLQWVTHATRPLRLIELAIIHSLQPGDMALMSSSPDTKQTVQNTCGPLLENLSDGTVQVIHHSFTEFITDSGRETASKHSDLSFPSIEDTETHSMMSKTCLRYLISAFSQIMAKQDEAEDDPDDSPFLKYREDSKELWRETSRQYPFLEYASSYWAVHTRLGHVLDKEHLRLLDAFLLEDKNILKGWLQFYWLTFSKWDGLRIDSTLGALHVTGYFGLTQYADCVLESGRISGSGDIEEPDHSSQSLMTPLSLAAEQGHCSTVALLLKDSKLDFYCRHAPSPLDYAASSGHDDIVKLLLTAGFQPNPHGTECCSGYWPNKRKERETYRCAISNGNTSVVQILLDHLGHSDLGPDSKGRTLLHLAAKYGRTATVTFLLTIGRHFIDLKDKYGFTPLYMAASKGDAATVRTLLDHGADPHLRFRPKPPFAKFSKMSNQPITTLLHIAALRQPFVLMDASSADDTEDEFVARELLKAGLDVNLRDSVGETPLHLATRRVKSIRMLQLFLQYAADVSIADSQGNQPLHIAPTSEMIRALVDAGADLDARQIDGRTPLLAHVNGNMYGPDESIETLVKLGADVNAQDENGNSALLMSMCRYSDSLCKILLDHGADVNVRNRKSEGLLHKSGEHNDLRYGSFVLGLLERKKLDIDAQDQNGETALFWSARRGEAGKFSALLHAGANVNCPDHNGRSILHAAVASTLGRFPDVNHHHSCRAKVEILKMTLKTDLDPCVVDRAGNTALMEMAKANWRTSDQPLNGEQNSLRLKAIDLLVSAGISPETRNSEGKSCLHLASANIDPIGDWHGRLGPTELPLHKFIGLEIDVNSVDHKGRTPLHLAAAVERRTRRIAEQHVWKLLDAGANPMLKSSNRKTPLHLAAQAGQCGSVDVLVHFMSSRLESVNDRDATGKTSLHYACASGKVESVRSLLRSGARLNAEDCSGKTPLHEAVRRPSPEYCLESNDFINDSQLYSIISLLISAGANVHAKDNSGATPIGMAINLGSHEALDGFFAASGASDMAQWVREYHSPNDLQKSFSAIRTVDNAMASSRAMRNAIRNTADESLINLFCNVVRHGDTRAVDELINLGADMFKAPSNRYDDRDSGPPFHLMARWGHVELMKKVVDQETVQKRGSLQQTLLHYAALSETNNVDVMRSIIDQGLDANERAEHAPDQDFSPDPTNGPTALHYLAQSNYYWQIEAMQYLISVGGDINLGNELCMNCLQLTIDRGGSWRHQMIALLLKNDAKITEDDGENRSVLYSATAAGDLDLMRLLLDNGANPNEGKYLPVHEASRLKNVVALRLLIEKGASVKIKPTSTVSFGYRTYQSPLYAATYLSFFGYSIEIDQKASEVLRILLENGADINEKADDGYSLMHAIAHGGGLLDKIIKAGGDVECVDSEGKTPLLCASTSVGNSCLPHRRASPVLVLLEAGANAKAVDKVGQNALHLLFLNTSPRCGGDSGWEEVVSALLSQGCSHSAPDNRGFTPLHYALKMGRFSAVARLIDAGADVRSQDPDGNNALHRVAHYLSRYSRPKKNHEIKEDPRPFFDRCIGLDGVDINQRNNTGATPIFNAVTGEFTDEHLQLWLDAGAGMEARNHEGEGLLHIVAKGSKDVCRKGCSITCECNSDRASDEGGYERAKFELLVSHARCRLDPRLEDRMERTPLDVAAASGFTEILKLFKED
ncbi:MAG: hypothetical protein Q9160_005109 [Pyrenula sp. 1 TL-2023]